jgi:hypothetical protein
MATCSLDVCPLAERISSRVQDSIVCTSGRNLGTLIVTNGFLRTSAYVIISNETGQSSWEQSTDKRRNSPDGWLRFVRQQAMDRQQILPSQSP